ncbi:MAG: hypothetical protein VKO39_14250 [Cyanobacteriota bacterium]|nr:hypothetical protein [Cyanobacteriota bacterium]
MVVESSGCPEASSLQALELRSRRQGSGLGRDDLLGDWRLERVWSKGRSQPSQAAGGVLRALTARLGIHLAADGGMLLSNSIALGPLKLCFDGTAALQGRRPLLMFQFHTLRLSVAEHTLWTRSLPMLAKGQAPFFALIASQPTGHGPRWLAARGRGGGLALWLREADGSP